MFATTSNVLIADENCLQIWPQTAPCIKRRSRAVSHILVISSRYSVVAYSNRSAFRCRRKLEEGEAEKLVRLNTGGADVLRI
jgi:hypothetical protein